MTIITTRLLNREQLYDQFQQTMRLPVTLAGEMRLRGALQALMGELLICHNPDARAQSMLLACRLRLRALQNMVLAQRAKDDFALQHCDLRIWMEDLCAAADMLLHPLGRSVQFEAPEEVMEAACAPRDIGWLLLELICNCGRHCHGEEIRVTMTCKRPSKHRWPQSCFVTVECKGALDLDCLHAAGKRIGSGVTALRRIASLHRGSLLWLGRDGISIAALRLPMHANANAAHPCADTPDFVELLSDQVSLVYTALSPVIGELRLEN